MCRCVILITGLGKSHRLKKGLVEVYERISADCPTDVSVGLYRWGTVERIVADIRDQEPSEVIFSGHSYGISSAAFVCKEIERSMPWIKVPHFISTDGVWRPEIDSPAFKSLFDGHSICLPNVIQNFYSFRQRHSIINGHDFKVGLLTNWLVNEWVMDRGHVTMDRHKPFMDLTIGLACNGTHGPGAAETN